MSSPHDEPTSRDTAEQSDAEHVILVAEDDSDLRDTYRAWLTDDEQWAVREAADGNEALDLLDENVDVMVLDRRMPGASGPEVVERLDNSAFDGDVLVISAFQQDRHLNDDDVEAYISKPIQKDAFLDTLRQALPTD